MGEYIIKIFGHDRNREIGFGKNHAQAVRNFNNIAWNKLEPGESCELIYKSSTGEKLMREYTNGKF